MYVVIFLHVTPKFNVQPSQRLPYLYHYTPLPKRGGTFSPHPRLRRPCCLWYDSIRCRRDPSKCGALDTWAPLAHAEDPVWVQFSVEPQLGPLEGFLTVSLGVSRVVSLWCPAKRDEK